MSFVMLIASGVLLALGGPSWYHTNSVGRFFDETHFWSVQLFFGGLVLHLATKFFSGAWRGGRWLTWMVGALLFALAIFTGLTGYLLQTNWDSQWIATQAKDAMNAAGIGAVFNTMNTGQVLMLHAIVLPLHRRRDRYPPAAHPPRQPRSALRGLNSGRANGEEVAVDEGALDLAGAGARTRENLKGIPLKPYDLLREGAVVLAFVLVVVVVLSIVFKAPDYPTITAQNVATQQPLAFLQTASGILANDGSVSAVSDYGPPYDSDTSAAQHIGPINPAAWAKAIFGVTTPINPPQDLIIAPLRRAAVLDPSLSAPLAAFESASPAQRSAWLAAYRGALGSATVSGEVVTLPAGDYGPVASLMDGMLRLGRSGLLEGAFAAQGNTYYPYNFDFTKALPSSPSQTPTPTRPPICSSSVTRSGASSMRPATTPALGGSTSTSSGTRSRKSLTAPTRTWSWCSS